MSWCAEVKHAYVDAVPLPRPVKYINVVAGRMSVAAGRNRENRPDVSGRRSVSMRRRAEPADARALVRLMVGQHSFLRRYWLALRGARGN
jgi:hypothetical protein